MVLPYIDMNPPRVYGQDSWESHGRQGGQTSQSQRKSTLNINWKDWSWSTSTLATWCEELTHWKRPWCWEGLRAGGEGATEDEMVGWHHRHNGHGFGWTLGDTKFRAMGWEGVCVQKSLNNYKIITNQISTLTSELLCERGTNFFLFEVIAVCFMYLCLFAGFVMEALPVPWL